MRLEGKVALVTGAQQGIGRAIAVALARDGADVGVNFLDDASAAEGVAGEIRGLGRRAVTVQGDVSRVASVESLVKTVVDALGPPDVLVNNAGVFPRAAFLELREREWDHVLGINLKGSFLCAQAVARALVAAGRPGAIVNIPPARREWWASPGPWPSPWRPIASGSMPSPPASPTPRSRATAIRRSRSPRSR